MEELEIYLQAYLVRVRTQTGKDANELPVTLEERRLLERTFKQEVTEFMGVKLVEREDAVQRRCRI